jgi:hypothetical protein
MVERTNFCRHLRLLQSRCSERCAVSPKLDTADHECQRAALAALEAAP